MTPVSVGIPVHAPSAPIEENSLLLKIASCLPIIGPLISFAKLKSLAHKIEETREVPRLVELIDTLNDYKQANVVNSLLTVALLIAKLTLVVIPLGQMIVDLLLVAVLLGLAGYNVYAIQQNALLIAQLQSTGFQRGMTVR